MDGRRVLDRTERGLSEKGANLVNSSQVPEGSVAVSCIGWQMGKAVLVTRPSFTNQQLNTVVPTGEVLPEFLYYHLCTRQAELKNLGSVGVRTPILNKSRFEELEIAVPPEAIQRRIVGLLSAYDELVENNTKRVKILEEIARSLYRDWFVSFRFPGHEKTKFVKSPLGMIPADWRVDRLDSALVLQRGFDLPVGARVPGTVPIYAATGVVGTHEIAKAKGPGVVTGRSGSLGTVLFVREDYWPLNTALWVKEFRSVRPVFAYFLLSNLDLKGMDGGAAVPTLNRNHAHALNVAIPPVGLVHHFEALADDFLRQTETLAKARDILRATRDLLLPRLISGDIDVSSLPLEPAAS
jgi:type I restriction enzyme S subunit